jgi:hypothetical protein
LIILFDLRPITERILPAIYNYVFAGVEGLPEFPSKVIKLQFANRLTHRRERVTLEMKKAIGYPGRGWLEKARDRKRRIEEVEDSLLEPVEEDDVTRPVEKKKKKKHSGSSTSGGGDPAGPSHQFEKDLAGSGTKTTVSPADDHSNREAEDTVEPVEEDNVTKPDEKKKKKKHSGSSTSGGGDPAGPSHQFDIDLAGSGTKTPAVPPVPGNREERGAASPAGRRNTKSRSNDGNREQAAAVCSNTKTGKDVGPKQVAAVSKINEIAACARELVEETKKENEQNRVAREKRELEREKRERQREEREREREEKERERRESNQQKIDALIEKLSSKAL